MTARLDAHAHQWAVMCDTCGLRLPAVEGHSDALRRARARGWAVTVLGGDPKVVDQCPACAQESAE